MRNRTRKTRAAILAAATTGLVGAGLAVTAVPAQAVDVCHVHVESVTAWDLNDNDGEDEMKIKLGDSGYYGPWDMWDDWMRNDSLGTVHKDFTGSIDVGLYEQDATRQTIDVDNIGCSILGERTLELDGNGAIYRMVVDVSVR